MRIAVVHDWLVTYAGAEKVLEQILHMYPQADLFSLIEFLPEDGRGFILNKKVRTSFIQRLPFARTRYRNYLPLMPTAVERFDLSGYDLVISSSYAVVKGVPTGPGQAHISYCFTPLRYAWDLRAQYLEATGLDRGIKGMIAALILDYVRDWDFRTAEGVDFFIAISEHVKGRIKRFYNRDSTVIYPPVDIHWFTPGGEGREDLYLTASRLVPYKKVDMIVEAFAGMPNKRLVVIGEGPDFKKIKAKATRNTLLLGYQPPDVLRDYMRRAKAFLFAAEEDFGITPVEAQACGTPVIAYARGGASETVIEGKTGIFFKDQSSADLREAVLRFEGMRESFDPAAIRRNAERFGTERFREEFRRFVQKHTAS
jgi:glycosyltransferase involved in cell wall biosynthesis